MDAIGIFGLACVYLVCIWDGSRFFGAKNYVRQGSKI